MKMFTLPELEQLWDEQDLSDLQLSVLRKHHGPIDNTIQRLGIDWAWIADMLLSLESDLVRGSKTGFLKKLFGKHQELIVDVLKKGKRIHTKSDQFHNILFELILIHFFVLTGFEIELAQEKGGKAVPEFWLSIDDDLVGIEAKRMNDDSVLDYLQIIHKERSSEVEPEKLSPIESLDCTPEEAATRLRNGIVRNYSDAVSKFADTEDPYIVLIHLPYPLTVLEPYIGNFSTYLIQAWSENPINELLCVGCVSPISTEWIINSNSQEIDLSSILDHSVYKIAGPDSRL